MHRQFYERRQDWFQVLGQMHFVMWWVPAGHKPTLAQALDRLEHLRRHGDSEQAFGWRWLRQAQLYKSKACAAG